MHGLRALRAPAGAVAAMTGLERLRNPPQVGATIYLPKSTYFEILIGGSIAAVTGAVAGYAATKNAPAWRFPAEIAGALGGAVVYKMLTSPSVQSP